MYTMTKNIRRIFALTVLSLCLFSCGAPRHVSNVSHDVGGSGGSSPRSQNESRERMLVYSMSLHLVVASTEETRAVLHEQIKKFDGFVVRETDEQIIMRIPAEYMTDFIDSARALGRVEHLSRTGADISDQYRDNVSRLQSLERMRDRYLVLLERANMIVDILNIERELERVNTEIEILKGRIQHAELSVAYSNITVRFREKTRLGPVGWVFYGLYRGIGLLFVW